MNRKHCVTFKVTATWLIIRVPIFPEDPAEILLLLLFTVRRKLKIKSGFKQAAPDVAHAECY